MILVLAAMLVMTLSAWAGSPGVPFYRTILPSEYNAHSRNYDIACNDFGCVFVANFESLLYYDGAIWRKLYTPGISRITRVARGKNNRIWFGGNNVFGYLYSDDKGIMKMKTIVSDLSKFKLSEVDFIKVTNDKVYVHTTAHKTYYVVNDKSLKELKYGGEKIFTAATDSVNKYKNIPKAIQKKFAKTLQYVSYNRKHAIWGATSEGLFMVQTPSVFSKLDEGEGLTGEVNSICQMDSRYYFGTMQGLYYASNGEAHIIPGVDLACWQLLPIDSQHMLIASSEGLLMYNEAGLHHITNEQAYSVCVDTNDGGYITGEADGVYHTSQTGVKTKISHLEKVTNISYSAGKVKAMNLYCEQWEITMSKVNGKIVSHDRCINRHVDKSTLLPSKKIQQWLFPFTKLTINCLYQSKDGILCVGGEFGAYFLDTNAATKQKKAASLPPYIRQVTIMGDSIIWGGFTKGTMAPVQNIDDLELPYDCDDISISYSTMETTLAYPSEYRYRIEGGKWSAWSSEHNLELHSIDYGSTRIDIQARDAYGRPSDKSTVRWYKHVPFYLTWWAIAIYIILIIYFIYWTVRWRMRRLEAQKQHLETLVDERTADLKRTQADLVRMERTATAGKLTQGLIDRILNPINYINNFSKLTSGLAKDLKEDIEDEKEHMTEDNFDDCEDILEMMDTNLKKIEEHGVNTTRTLRAMEAILNSKIGTLREQDICALCQQSVDVTKKYYDTLITENNINIKCNIPENDIIKNIDGESISKAIISILNNGIYSVTKKASIIDTEYSPEVVLTVSQEDEDKSSEAGKGDVTIVIRDNGVGIEPTVMDKIFDPFFTTKTTSEASGVGLYLVRNIINDHHGTINVNSVKREYCEFTIKL